MPWDDADEQEEGAGEPGDGYPAAPSQPPRDLQEICAAVLFEAESAAAQLQQLQQPPPAVATRSRRVRCVLSSLFGLALLVSCVGAC